VFQLILGSGDGLAPELDGLRRRRGRDDHRLPAARAIGRRGSDGGVGRSMDSRWLHGHLDRARRLSPVGKRLSRRNPTRIRFRPPPGWPPAPRGWEPGPGWRADPEHVPGRPRPRLSMGAVRSRGAPLGRPD
jgi:hypothetical protein